MGMETSPRGLFNTMVRPQNLLAVGQAHPAEWPFSRMAGSERDMAPGMPVLGEEYEVKPAGKLIDDGDYGVGIGYGQRSARAEVSLDIDDHKGRLLHGFRRQSAGRATEEGMSWARGLV